MSTEERLPLSILMFIGAIVVTAIAFSLSMLDIVTSSANSLFAFFVAVLIVTVVILIAFSYPKASPFDVGIAPVTISAGLAKGASSEAGDEDRIPSYSELKRLLINRVQLRRKIDGVTWAAIKNDRMGLSRIIGDDDLVDLAMFDDAVRFDQRRDGYRSLSREQFETLLGKVEKWR